MPDPNGLIPLAMFITAIARLLEALRKWWRRYAPLPFPFPI